MAANVLLLEVQPRNPSTGARSTVRLAGGGAVHPYHYDGQGWIAGLDAMPTIIAGLEFTGVDLGTGSVPQSFNLRWAFGTGKQRDELAAWHWGNAPFTLYFGPENAGGTLPPVLLTGTILQHTIRDGKLELALADPGAQLQKPVLVDTYLGTGGLEGPAEWEGRPRRRAWGRVFNVAGAIIDEANNVFAFTDHNFPLDSFADVRDSGASAASLTILTDQGGAAATFAALQEATAPQGGGVACPSLGMVKWWTRPAGILAADLVGEGGVTQPGDIAAAIVSARSTATFAAGTVTAANTARAFDCGILLETEGQSVAQALDYLLGGVSLYWKLEAGEIVIGEWGFGLSSASFASTKADRIASYAPLQERRLGYRRNHRVHAAGDIAAIVTYGDGTPIDDLQPDSAGATKNEPGQKLQDAAFSSAWWQLSGGAGQVATSLSANGSALEVLATNGSANLTEYLGTIEVEGGKRLWLRFSADPGASELVEVTSEGQPVVSNGDPVLASSNPDADWPLIVQVEWLDTSGAVLLTETATEVAVAQGRQTITAALIAPVGARTMRLRFGHAAALASATGSWLIWQPWLNEHQPASDVTAQNTPTISGPGPQTVTFGTDGSPTSGQLPRALTFGRRIGSLDVTQLANWAAVFSGLTGTIDNSPSSGTRGRVEVTAMDGGSGSVVVSAEYDGVSVSRTVEFTAEQLTASGSGPATQVDVAIAASVSSSSYGAAAATAVMDVTNGTISVLGFLSYTTDHGTAVVAEKARYSVAGAGSWSDFGAEKVGSTANTDFNEGYQEEIGNNGSLNAAQSVSGLAAGQYDVEILLRKVSGTAGAALVTGNLQIQAD